MKKHTLTDLFWGVLLVLAIIVLSVIVTKTASKRATLADSSWHSCMEVAEDNHIYGDDLPDFLKGCME